MKSPLVLLKNLMDKQHIQIAKGFSSEIRRQNPVLLFKQICNETEAEIRKLMAPYAVGNTLYLYKIIRDYKNKPLLGTLYTT